MKYSQLTTTIMAAMVAMPTVAVEIYQDDTSSLSIGGRAEARFNVSDNNKTNGNSTFDDRSRARLNIDGSTKISENLSGFGYYEAEFDTGSSSSINNRYVYAGINSEIGKFSYGKQDSAQVMLTDITDTMATFGADAADLTYGNQDKRDANFAYSGEFDQLLVKANYLAAQSDDNSDRSIGVAGLYNLDNMQLGVGFVSSDDDYQFNLAGNLNIDAFIFGAFFAFGEADKDDATAVELSAMYTLGKAVIVAVYNKSEYDAASKNSSEADNIAIEGVYKFNGNLRSYVGYKFEQIDDLDNQLQAGVRYDF